METTETEIIHELEHEIYHLYLEMAISMYALYVVFKLEIFSPIC